MGLAIFQAIPASWLAPLASGLGRVYSTFPRERSILRKNLRRVLDIDLDTDTGRVMARRIYRNQIICAMEALRGIHRPELVIVEGLGEMRAAFEHAEAAGKGQLLVTAHLGSWELIEIFIPGCLEGKFYELAKPMRIKAFTRIIEKLRLRAGTHVLWNDQKLLLRSMLKILRRGDTLGLACDQKPKQLLGPVVDFLGQETEFVGGPGAVAAKTGCAVIAVFCVRQGSFSYRLVTEELLPPDHGERDALAITQLIANSIEGAIRRNPDQWPWTYRRWIFDDDPWQSRRGADRKRSAGDEDGEQSSGSTSEQIVDEMTG